MQFMRFLKSSCFLAALAALTLLLVSCGSSSPAGTNVPTTLIITPSSLSMNPGQVVQLSAELDDGTGTALTNTVFTYTATGGVQVSTQGLVCAGTWDSLTVPVICTAGPQTGTGVVTVTSAGITTTVNAAIHTRIARVTIATTPPPLCNSQTETQQYVAHAFDTQGNDITAQAGAFTYTSSNTVSVTIDATGLATSVQPGGAFITASNNGVFSVPSTFNSCQPLSIVLAPPTPVSLTVGATTTLTATVTDIKGNSIAGTSITLTYLSSSPTVASAVPTTGVITGIAAGATGIVASCSPPLCNGGANANIPVYSNIVPVTVTGTSSTTVYVTGATSTTIVPIDATANTAGTAIAVPQDNSVQPTINSLVFSADATTGLLGTDHRLLVLDVASNTITASSVELAGKVLAISPDGTEAIVANQSAAPSTYVYDVGTDTFTLLPLTTVTTSASFSADSLKAFIVSGGALWVASGALAPPLLRQVVNSTTATDSTFLTQGSLGYVSGVTPNTVNAYATCDNSKVATVSGLAATPLKVASSFDSAHVFAVDTTSINDISVSNISTVANKNCPATVTNSLATFNFGQGTFTPDQIIQSSDSSNVFVTTPTNKLLRYVVSGNAVSAITLATGTAITTGGITQDNKSVYVGATGTNDVHRIDVASASDAQQIAVSLKDINSAAVSPDFVAVLPK